MNAVARQRLKEEVENLRSLSAAELVGLRLKFVTRAAEHEQGDLRGMVARAAVDAIDGLLAGEGIEDATRRLQAVIADEMARQGVRA